MIWNTLSSELLSAAEKTPLQIESIGDQFRVVLDSEDEIKQFIDENKDQISKVVTDMRSLWDKGREMHPGLTIDQFWECHLEHFHDKDLKKRGYCLEDSSVKQALAIVKLVDRIAWIFLKVQLRREAGVV